MDVESERLWTEKIMWKIRNFFPPNFPKIVCLCGSTRFADAYRDANRSETLAGNIVLSVGLLGHAEGIDMSGPVKVGLDELHMRKIDLADEILVVSVGGYIGLSTGREIDYAFSSGKRVRWVEQEAEVTYHALAKGEKA